MRRSLAALRAGTGLLLVAAAAVAGASQLGSPFGAVHARAATTVAIPPLPRVGASQTVDQNDVGDPFILAVPPGIDPPSDVPFMDSGPDSYQSSPWSPATAASAKSDGWYVLFGTTDWQENVPTAISSDLTHWTQAPDALPVLPSWAAPSISMTWAPAAVQRGVGWVLYFSTQEKSSNLECIGAAVSDSPAGPYRDRSASPLLCQRALGGSIDPSIVRHGAGTEYLVWKNNGNAAHSPDAIWSQQLTASGLGLVGQPHRLLGADQAWTHGIVEGPALLPASVGGYWLFYAGGDWNSNQYDTGLAYCAKVTGPCAETAAGPFLATTASLVSPAGLDTVIGPDGKLWAAFTSLVLVPSPWHPGHSYYNRVLDIAPILSR
jgi:beta-xylosidase